MQSAKPNHIQILRRLCPPVYWITEKTKYRNYLKKYDILPKDIRWHMIGHLQRNKVKYLVGKVSLIHSVDSLRLANQIETEFAKKRYDCKCSD